MTPPAYRRSFDNSKPNPNAVTFASHKLRKAKISRISKTFWEKNVGTTDKPKYVPAKEGDEGARPQIKVYVTFPTIANAEGQELVLGKKMTFSFAPRATLAILIAGVLGISPDEVENAKVDTDMLVNQPVIVNTKAIGENNIAVLTTITAAPRDDDDDALAAPAPRAAQRQTQYVADDAPALGNGPAQRQAYFADDEDDTDDQIPF